MSLAGGLNVFMAKGGAIKIHFAVNGETKEVVAMGIIIDDVHDSEAIPKLICEAEGRGGILNVYMDGS
jgi:hypothetical protein